MYSQFDRVSYYVSWPFFRPEGLGSEGGTFIGLFDGNKSSTIVQYPRLNV